MGLVEIDSVDNRKEVVVTESGVDFIMKLETLLSPLETLEEKRTLYGQDPMKDVASPNAPKIH